MRAVGVRLRAHKCLRNLSHVSFGCLYLLVFVCVALSLSLYVCVCFFSLFDDSHLCTHAMSEECPQFVCSVSPSLNVNLL